MDAPPPPQHVKVRKANVLPLNLMFLEEISISNSSEMNRLQHCRKWISPQRAREKEVLPLTKSKIFIITSNLVRKERLINV